MWVESQERDDSENSPEVEKSKSKSKSFKVNTQYEKDASIDLVAPELGISFNDGKNDKNEVFELISDDDEALSTIAEDILNVSAGK